MTRVDWIKVEDRTPTDEEAKEPLWVLCDGLIYKATWTAEGVWTPIENPPEVLHNPTHWAKIPTGKELM